jgi:hypothetical protein
MACVLILKACCGLQHLEGDRLTDLIQTQVKSFDTSSSQPFIQPHVHSVVKRISSSLSQAQATYSQEKKRSKKINRDTPIWLTYLINPGINGRKLTTRGGYSGDDSTLLGPLSLSLSLSLSTPSPSANPAAVCFCIAPPAEAVDLPPSPILVFVSSPHCMVS